ncbi:hypothetical protein PIB30_002172 [Stylosanthes scabra]|uniref:Uncharacterized protein n=1 Tax=Stylosanthes scabra TaxID=79078 RepID=A0ABU6S3F3_9FABA|nr:hypothetical protein [Stylosanthes scabra]
MKFNTRTYNLYALIVIAMVTLTRSAQRKIHLKWFLNSNLRRSQHLQPGQWKKTFKFGKSNDVLKDDTQVHQFDAARNDEDKEGNWTKITGKLKTKQGEQARKPKHTFASKLNKGKVQEATANSVKKKTGQVGTRLQTLSSQANTPSKFAIRKRQRSSSAQSSPELRQISSVHASSSGTKNEEPIKEEVRKETPLVNEVSPQSLT